MANSQERLASEATLREHFAAMAMQGIMANSGYFEVVADAADMKGVSVEEFISTAAADMADALLSELERTS